MYHLSFGALSKESNEYIYPAKAERKIIYKCPKCNKDVIVRKGKVRIHHFAHLKSDSPCEYYNHQGESEIHKEAKLLLKTILDEKRKINILRSCYHCHKKKEHYNYNNIYIDSNKTNIEHSFQYNKSNKKADVALLNEDTIKIIFEIYHKHRTNDCDRPEPWFEIKADILINNINCKKPEDIIDIHCSRYYKCDECILKENILKEEREKERLEKIKREEEEKKRKEEAYQKYLIEQRQREEENLKKIKEESRRRLEEEEKKKRRQIFLGAKCDCGLLKNQICICINTEYIFNKDYKLYKCKYCLNWKDRCMV